MFENVMPKINKGDKLIIGLGDSFTQGIGAYTEETWAKNNYKISVATSDRDLIKEQFEGSWVNQLCKNHMTDWVPINLGHAGVGNRAGIKEIYLNPEIDLDLASDAIMVYVLSGLERFDFIRKNYNDAHVHFEAMWPNFWDQGATKPNLWKAYAEDVYSEQFVAMELMLNLYEAAEICKARNWKLIIASAFDMRINEKWLTSLFKDFKILSKNPQAIQVIKKFDWSLFYTPTSMTTLMEHLLDLEGNRDLAAGGYWKYYTNLPKPGRYVTNCCHPTREGQSVIAKLLYDEICFRKFI